MEGPRAAKSEELPEIIDLTNRIFMLPYGFPPIMGDAFPHLFNEENLENLRVMVEDGHVVSHVGIWEGRLLICGSWFNVGMVGAVCTNEGYRRRGYASALIADALNKMREDRIDFVMISGDRGLYRQFGFFKSGIVHLYNVVPPLKPAANEKDFEMIIFDESRIGEIIAIYQMEPVRYKRSLEDFKRLTKFFTAPPKYDGLQAKIYLAIIKDETLAYVALASFPKIKFLRVCEYAGSRNAVSYLIAHILKSERPNRIELSVPFHDVELLRLLENYGLRKPPVDSEASMLITNPGNFFEKAKDYLAERVDSGIISGMSVTDHYGRVELSIKGDSLASLEPADLTLLFFGSPEKRRSMAKIEPIVNLLNKALPMPTPVYGLNYI